MKEVIIIKMNFPVFCIFPFSARAVADLFNNSSRNGDQYYLYMYFIDTVVHPNGMLHSISSVWMI